MKPLTLLTPILLHAGLSLASAAPECILNIEEIPPKGITQVWSPLFQATWDKLNEGSELAKVEPPNALITKLEKFQWQAEEVMPKDGYAVYGGPATQEFANETAASIREKFQIEFDPNRLPITPQGKAAYGILLRDLKFKKPFFRARKNPMEFRDRTGKTHQVEFFGSAGAYSANYGNHVKILHYDPKNSSFSLSVATDKQDEKLIVYRPKEACSFHDAIKRVKQALKTPLTGPAGSLLDGSLHREDAIKIPYITINADSDFTALLGGLLHYSDEPLPWHITGAFQRTQFELFEKGARVRVETGASADPFGAPSEPPPVVPRDFVCDQSFYLFLWKTDADIPYLATWIDGSDSLTEFTK